MGKGDGESTATDSVTGGKHKAWHLPRKCATRSLENSLWSHSKAAYPGNGKYAFGIQSFL